MPNRPGAWIAPTLAFAHRLVGTTIAERTKAYKEESAQRGVTILTLRRTINAAIYCARHAKSVDMKIEKVTAAALAIELFMRLERRDRAGANDLRKRVLEGRISVRKMRKILAYVPIKRRRGRSMDEWTNFASSMIDQCYLNEVRSYQNGENSALGKLLKVDIEVYAMEQPKPDAIFISPLDEYSECAGLSIDDQIPFIIAATLRYGRVNAVLHEPAEAKRLQTVLDMLRRPLPELRLIGLYKEVED